MGRRGRLQFYTGDRRFENKPIDILGRRRWLFWVSFVRFAYSLVSRRGRVQFCSGDRRFENKPIGILGRRRRLFWFSLVCVLCIRLWVGVATFSFTLVTVVYKQANRHLRRGRLGLLVVVYFIMV